jgi:hypothetical protein
MLAASYDACCRHGAVELQDRLIKRACPVCRRLIKAPEVGKHCRPALQATQKHAGRDLSAVKPVVRCTAYRACAFLRSPSQAVGKTSDDGGGVVQEAEIVSVDRPGV